MYQESLEDVGVPAVTHPAQASSFIEMGVVALEAVAALAQQPQPASTPAPSPVGVLLLPGPPGLSCHRTRPRAASW